MKIINKPRNLQEHAQFENASASCENNKAFIDFLSMMAGIDIPTEDDSEVATNEE